MAEFVLSGIGIGGISCAVPENKVDNAQQPAPTPVLIDNE